MDLVEVDGAEIGFEGWTLPTGLPAARLDIRDPAVGRPLSLYVAGTGRDDVVLVAVDSAKVAGPVGISNGARPVSLPAPVLARRSEESGALEVYVQAPFPPLCLHIGPSDVPDRCVLAIVGPGAVLLEHVSDAELEHLGSAWAGSDIPR